LNLNVASSNMMQPNLLGMTKLWEHWTNMDQVQSMLCKKVYKFIIKESKINNRASPSCDVTYCSKRSHVQLMWNNNTRFHPWNGHILQHNNLVKSRWRSLKLTPSQHPLYQHPHSLVKLRERSSNQMSENWSNLQC
jgi:hypothetical protein